MQRTRNHSYTDKSCEPLHEVLLAELRAGVLHAKLAVLEMESVGVAVRFGLVSVEEAMALLDARDCLPWVLQDRGTTT